MDDNFTISILGIPVFSAGLNPFAVIAVGVAPRGIIAIGWMSLGVIAVGQVSAGIIAFGQVSAGVLVIAQVGVSVFFMGQAGIGLVFAAGQAVAGFISNGLGYYKVYIRLSTSLREYPEIIKDAVSSSPRPLIIWSVFWSTAAVIGTSSYFFYIRDALSRLLEK